MQSGLRRGLLGFGLLGGLLFGSGVSHADAPPSTAEVLGKLHLADQKEVQAGEIAEKNGQSSQVRSFGKMLVQDHTAADKKVAALAKDENIDLKANTPAPSPNDMGTMATTGSTFDKMFAQDMAQDHKKDIAEVTEVRNTTSDPKLRQLLTDMLPTLEKHEETAQKIIDAQAK
jgi:putative membrane protein